MSSARTMRHGYYEHGSPTPRIRVGYTHQPESQLSSGISSRDVLPYHQPLKRSSGVSTSSSASSSSSSRDRLTQAMDQQLRNLAELLSETVLLSFESPVDPALFLSMGCLELYDQDQRQCVQSLREERKRLLDRRHAIEMEGIRQDIAETQLKVEQKRLHQLEMSSETAALAPESLAPMSKSRVRLLDDLGNILSKIRTSLETVHLQVEEGLIQESRDGSTAVKMELFQQHGLMDLYDRDPVRCISLLRVEHARLAVRRDELELEYERQRTALLRTMQ